MKIPMSDEQKRRSAREGSRFCIEYWLKRGYSQEQGRTNISLLQKEYSKGNIGTKRSDTVKAKCKEAQRKLQTEEYWITKHGKEQGKILFAIYQEQKKERGRLGSIQRKLNGTSYKESSVRCVEYWIKRGFTEVEAKRMVSLSQSRSLSFFEKKYGTEVGLMKWTQKQNSWRKSFLKNNQDEINEKRRLNAHVGLYTPETITNIDELYFYCFVFIDVDGTQVLKYGLTKHDSLYKRWSPNVVFNVVYFEKLPANEALSIETYLNKKYGRTHSPQLIQTTECMKLTEETLKDVQKEFQNAQSRIACKNHLNI